MKTVKLCFQNVKNIVIYTNRIHIENMDDVIRGYNLIFAGYEVKFNRNNVISKLNMLSNKELRAIHKKVDKKGSKFQYVYVKKSKCEKYMICKLLKP